MPRHPKIKLLMALLLSMMTTFTALSGIRVSLLTAHAGSDIYQLEGHTALRIVDDDLGHDYVVNWGLFDFDSPNFVYRFVKGETDYMAGISETGRFLAMYGHERRKVVEQVLNLTPQETQRIVELTNINLLPFNRTYRYNYVLDNCATRPLAIIEKAVGDTLSLGYPGIPDANASTFRSVMRHYHTNYPWYQFGIDLALGSGIDRPITNREVGFAPEALERMLDKATTSDGRPIVSNEYVIINHPSAIAAPTPWWLTPMFFGIIVMIIAVWISYLQLKRQKYSTGARLFDTAYYSMAGLTGCVIAFLIFISVHEATSPNWLLLWLNPLCFIAAIAVWAKRLEKLLICYQFVNFALLITLVVVLAMGVQSPNPAFWPLIVADGVRAATFIYIYYNKRCHHAKTDR